jgi:hypothetical protein
MEGKAPRAISGSFGCRAAQLGEMALLKKNCRHILRDKLPCEAPSSEACGGGGLLGPL